MNLNELLAGVPVTKMFQTVFGKMASTHDVMVSGIQYDSRRVERGCLFVALRGGSKDGHAFIGEAISKGAKVIVTEDDANPPDPLCMHTGTVKLVVDDTRKALALLSANYFGHPAKRLCAIGVTGTNGKTTTAYLIKQMLEADPAVKAGLIGTVEYMIGNEKLPATHTTPESLELHGLFARMLAAGCTHVVMEVSSHALAQERVYGIPFRAAVFTNLTQDHLDYHHTMEEYFAAKKILFDTLPGTSTAVVNAESPYAQRIVEDTKAHTVSYGIASEAAAIRAEGLVMTKEGFSAAIGPVHVEAPLTGRFNVLNFLAAYAAVKSVLPALELSAEQIRGLAPAPGRFEQFHSEKGWTAIVDYAHTPDAITNCLETIRAIVPRGSGRTVTIVFGAGGDRDTSKRPLMGAAAEALSDRVIVTSDNPRTENPSAIIEGILSGMKRPELAEIEPDRRLAIGRALESAREGDVILIAGKGHEDYQVIGTEKIHLSDKELVRQHL